MTSLEIILTIVFTICTLGFFIFTLVSWKEKHHRAALIGMLFTLLTSMLITITLLAPTWVQILLIFLIGAGLIVAVFLFFQPAKQEPIPSPPPQTRIDERTIMFARARLQPGSPAYVSYYNEHPDHLQPDNAFRKNPGLLTPGAVFYDRVLAPIAEGSFFETEALREAVDGPVADVEGNKMPGEFSSAIKSLALYLGAIDVGICRLESYHIYSHIGRGTGTYGAPITLDHQFAIAFTVEMVHEMIMAAPKMPAVMESARQYAETGKIAIALAAAIRELGYPARAHIDGNYRVIAPLVAKDAGLGEIGRMGLLMTPKLGPRIRLGVVTTDLPLEVDAPAWNPAVIDFCEICQKCALVCPAQAISFDDRQIYQDGTLRWKIDPEKCYIYWTKIGTDCGRCMAVCPYSHADNLLHNLIRYGVDRSANFRRAAIWMDDLFYGKKPKPHPFPKWVQDIQNSNSK